MRTFRQIEKVLRELEDEHFHALRSQFQPDAETQTCITGAVQFFATDASDRDSNEEKPVLCAIGVNYYSKNEPYLGRLYPLLEPAPRVTDALSRHVVSLVLSAYNRNSEIWVNKEPEASNDQPASPMRYYGSKNATARARLTAGDPTQIDDKFILVMTNVCPFITRHPWQRQLRAARRAGMAAACERLAQAYGEHLDALFNAIGSTIDLWIGHSAIRGVPKPSTQWVWPAFADFVNRKGIRDWLLSPNISAPTRNNFNLHFRKSCKNGKPHPLFDWFGP